jgi:hypothetical protein
MPVARDGGARLGSKSPKTPGRRLQPPFPASVPRTATGPKIGLANKGMKFHGSSNHAYITPYVQCSPRFSKMLDKGIDIIFEIV